MQAEQAAEARTVTRAAAAGETRNSTLLWAAAVLEGADGALGEANGWTAEARRAALESAAETLVQQRRYALASELFGEAAKGSTEAARLSARADLVRRVRRSEDVTLRADDPVTVVHNLILGGYARTLTDEQVRAWMVVPPEEKTPAADFMRGMDASLLPLRNQLRDGTLRLKVLGDFHLATSRVAVDGDAATGFRVRTVALDGSAHLFFLRHEAGADRIVTSNATPSALGREALRRLDLGETAAARTWLDWARELVSAPDADDPFGGHPVTRFWTIGQPGSLESARRAALALMARGGKADDSILPLVKERDSAQGSQRLDLEVALGNTYESSARYAELLEICDHLDAAQPLSPTVFGWRWLALLRLSRGAELRRAAEDRLKVLPLDPRALRALAAVAEEEDRYAESRARYLELINAGRGRALDYNNAAWASLVLSEADERAVDLARRALELDGGSRAAKHTAAALYAETGRLAEAHQTLVHLIDMRGGVSESEDWLVVGRVAEQYGEREYAATAYARVGRPKRPRLDHPWVLAQARLARLGNARSVGNDGASVDRRP